MRYFCPPEMKMPKKKAPAPDRAQVPAAPPAVWRPLHTWFTLALILAFTAALGATAIAQYRDSPFFKLPIIDEEAYVKWAEQIAAGDVIGTKVFYQDPLYPYSLALLFAVFGQGLFAVRVAQAVIGVLAVAVVFWTGRRLAGDAAGLLAAAVLAGYKGLYYFDLMIGKEPEVLLLSALSAAIGVWAGERPRSFFRFALLGFTLALLTLLRGNFQLVAVLILVWSALFIRGESWRWRLLRPLAVGVGLAVLIVPVTVRNYRIGGEFVLTTSQGGANFFIGNNAAANGRYVTLPFVRANPEWEAIDFKAEAEKRAGHELKPSEVSGFWFNEAFAWIAANPRAAAKLLLHKARIMMHQFEIADNHSLYLMREQFVPALWLPFLGHGLLWGPALVGLAVALRRDRRAQYPAAFMLLYTASMVPFFIVDRYRVPCLPALAVFSAVFVLWVRENTIARWEGPAFGHGLAALVTVIALLMLGLLPTSESAAPMGMEYYLLGNGYLKTGDPAEAIKWYDKALAARPDLADAAKNRGIALGMIKGPDIDKLNAEVNSGTKTAEELGDLGKQFEAAGQTRQAVAAYEKALTVNPDYFFALARLGYLFAMSPEVKDLNQAIAHLQRALVVDPNHVDTMNALGNCYFLSGNLAEAKHWWEEVLQRKPDHSGARSNLEQLKAREGGQ
jgi:4-amino-4-deoxy-L-arabinose transferase-like glycosyltransferase